MFQNYTYYPGFNWLGSVPTQQYILMNTNGNDVILAGPGTSEIIAAGTGSKVVVVLPGHMNPLANYSERASDVTAVLERHDPSLMINTLEKYGVSYVVISSSQVQDFVGKNFVENGKVLTFELLYEDPYYAVLRPDIVAVSSPAGE
jgi:uncharacterized membrane protein